MRAEWLDRNLINSPVYYTLATSEKILESELKRLKVDPKTVVGAIEGKAATTNFLTNDEGVCALVCLFEYKKLESFQIYALLVHEAVHIWQEIKDIIGEKNPSAEFEAYSIQRISQSLMYEFDRQTSGGKKNGNRKRA